MNLSPLVGQINAEVTEAQSLWSGFDGEQRFVLAILIIIFSSVIGIVLIGATCSTWKALRERQLEADLKRDMLDRGMTAGEIQQVIEATPRSGLDRWMGNWCKKE
jgi:hypothetical protein